EAGGVGHIAAAVEGKEFAHGGGVAALAGGGADGADRKAQAGLDGIQQAGFAHAGGAGQHADLASEGGAQFVHTAAGGGGGVEQAVAQGRVMAEEGFGLGGADEVGLV